MASPPRGDGCRQGLGRGSGGAGVPGALPEVTARLPSAEGWTEPAFLAAGSLPVSGSRPEPAFSLKSWGRKRSHGVHVLLSAGRAHPEKVSFGRVPAAAHTDAPREGPLPGQARRGGMRGRPVELTSRVGWSPGGSSGSWDPQSLGFWFASCILCFQRKRFGLETRKAPVAGSPAWERAGSRCTSQCGAVWQGGASRGHSGVAPRGQLVSSATLSLAARLGGAGMGAGSAAPRGHM